MSRVVLRLARIIAPCHLIWGHGPVREEAALPAAIKGRLGSDMGELALSSWRIPQFA